MKITKCRICKCERLETLLDLGYQKYTGVFPEHNSEGLGGGKLELVKCMGECGLVQLSESFDPQEMYGNNYGYHSSLNSSMVAHLNEVCKEICGKVNIDNDDVIVDIGSNDGTLLKSFMQRRSGAKLIGIDPSGGKFKEFYDESMILVEDFFSAKTYNAVEGRKKAKIVTSIAMFYDLEDPIAFAKDVYSILEEEGMWVIEQSYLPLMVSAGSYDTICHEHVEFYSLKQIDYIADKAGFKITDVSFNNINGGSFRISMAKKGSTINVNKSVKTALDKEELTGVNKADYFDIFLERIKLHKDKLLGFFEAARAEGKLVLGYGASTKGNVVLQYCGITKEMMPAIVEVNSDKYGCVTPGSNIPIISEDEGKKMNPDYFLVLPWHFKGNILEKEAGYRERTGVRFVFYLPDFSIE